MKNSQEISNALNKAISQEHPIDPPLKDALALSEPQRSYVLHEALCMASRVNHHHIDRLIKLGAPIQLPNNQPRSSALIDAAIGNRVTSINLLLTHPLDINFKDDRDPKAQGRTALHAAVNAGFESVERLLQAGADPTITMTMQGTEKKMTPKDVIIAIRDKHTPFLDQLHDMAATSIKQGYARTIASLDAAEKAWAAKAQSSDASASSKPAHQTPSPITVIFHDASASASAPAVSAAKPAASSGVASLASRFTRMSSYASFDGSSTPLLVAPKPLKPNDIRATPPADRFR